MTESEKTHRIEQNRTEQGSSWYVKEKTIFLPQITVMKTFELEKGKLSRHTIF